MARMMRCRTCGYVISESALGDVCPACGFPRKVFEEYEDRISPGRRRILDLDLHPVSVHFPQALAALIFMALVGSLIIRTNLSAQFISAARLMSVLLPFTVAASMAAGLLDGQTRFRRLGTPLLVRKMILGSILLVLSAIIAVIVLTAELESPTTYVVLALALGCLVCEFLLGRIGGRLFCAVVRG
jgi:hypothetical protein